MSGGVTGDDGSHPVHDLTGEKTKGFCAARAATCEANPGPGRVRRVHAQPP